MWPGIFVQDDLTILKFNYGLSLTRNVYVHKELDAYDKLVFEEDIFFHLVDCVVFEFSRSL